MNLDDESLLSAYLDDELDPADRLAVEWSVESSPPLAGQLRSLAGARDAVAGLDRPALPVDLGPSILVRLAADRRRAKLRALARPGRVALAVAGLSAMAASLLFALLQLHRSMHDQANTPIVALQPPVVPTGRPHPIPTPDRVPPPTIAEQASIVPPSDRLAAGPPTPGLIDETRERADRRRINEMLERPDVRLILITTDVIDAPEQIRNLIRKDARESAEFGRITLQAGIVIDPSRPDSAEVFVVPIDEGGRPSFVERLRGHFQDLREEVSPSPELVTQLTEIGHVAILQGTRASPLVDPPVPLQLVIAQKSTDPIDGRAAAEEPDGELVGATDPVGKADPGRVGLDLDSFVGPPRPSRRPSPSDALTLLVWVTRPSRH